MNQFFKKLSMTTLTLTLATTLGSFAATPVTSSGLRSKSAIDNWSSAKKEAKTVTNRVRIREEDRREFFDNGAEHFGITAEYSPDSFKKFHRALRQSIQEPSNLAIYSHDAPAGITHYNLRRDFVVKVAPEGHVIDIHRPTAKERHKLVTDLIRDKDPRAMIDLLRIVRHISRDDQKQVSTYLIKKIEKRKATKDKDWVEPTADAKVLDYLAAKDVPEILTDIADGKETPDQTKALEAAVQVAATGGLGWFPY